MSNLCFFLKFNFIFTLLQRSSFLCQEHFVFPVYQNWLQRLGLTWENDIFSFHELVYQELCSTSLGPEPRVLDLIISINIVNILFKENMPKFQVTKKKEWHISFTMVPFKPLSDPTMGNVWNYVNCVLCLCCIKPASQF